MPEIQFRRGEMQTFIATRSFALGATGVNIQKGQEILYDGAVSYTHLTLPTNREV